MTKLRESMRHARQPSWAGIAVGAVVAFLAGSLTSWIISDRSAGDVAGTAAASAIGVTLVLLVLRLLGSGQGDVRSDRN